MEVKCSKSLCLFMVLFLCINTAEAVVPALVAYYLRADYRNKSYGPVIVFGPTEYDMSYGKMSSYDNASFTVYNTYFKKLRPMVFIYGKIVKDNVILTVRGDIWKPHMKEKRVELITDATWILKREKIKEINHNICLPKDAPKPEIWSIKRIGHKKIYLLAYWEMIKLPEKSAEEEDFPDRDNFEAKVGSEVSCPVAPDSSDEGDPDSDDK